MKSRAKRILGLSGIAGLVILLWTGAWMVGRQKLLERIDPAIADLSDRGIGIACPDRHVGGWPLSLALDCHGVVATLADGSRLEAAGLTVRAAATDWHGLGFAFSGPVSVSRPDGSRLQADFATLTGRIAFTAGRADAVAADATDLKARLSGETVDDTAVSAGSLAIGADLDGSGDGRLTLKMASAGVAVGGRAIVPAPASLDLSLTLADAATALAGGRAALAAWQSAGGKLTVDRFDLGIAGGDFSAKGDVALDGAGYPTGTITTTAHGLDRIAAAARSSGRSPSPTLAGVAVAYLFMGKSAEDGGRRIVLTAGDGALAANGRRIARLSPLALE